MQAKWLNNVGQFTKHNSPTILSGIAVGGVIATAVLAVRATPKAVKRIQAISDDGELKVGKKDVVKETWTLYIPAGLSGMATIACIIGSNAIGMRRNAALLAAYSLVDSTFREYKDKVVEQIGKEKEARIGDAIMEDRIRNNPPKEVIIIEGKDHLVYESETGRYFRGNKEDIERAEIEINRRMVGGDMHASLNEFGDELGLPHTLVGDELGWNIDRPIRVIFSSHINECSGEPCLAIRYETRPFRDYGKCF